MFFLRVIKYFILQCLVFSIFAGVVGVFAVMYSYNRFTRDLPKIERINDYKPKAVTTIVADDGTPIARLFDEFRLPVSFDEIPPLLRQAFIAAEDANFYKHQGVDLRGIARAFANNILRRLSLRKGSTNQGGSTITQQTVKSLLLTRDKTFERKIKEAILAYRLEKSLTKDEILTIYLNEIFLGLNSYGVKSAAWMHFRKELKDLSLTEIAYLAGLPPRPSYLSDPKNKKDMEIRIAYVLEQMLRHNFISLEDAQEAAKQPLKVFSADLRTYLDVPYYSAYAMTELEEKLRIADPGVTSTNPGGYIVHTEVNLEASRKAEKAIQEGLRNIDKRRGWRGALKMSEDEAASLDIPALIPSAVYPAIVIGVTGTKVKVRVGEFLGAIDFSKNTNNWAKKFLSYEGNQETAININPLNIIKPQQVIEVSLSGGKELDANEILDISKEVEFNLDQTPEVEGALVLIDTASGAVKAIIGGYDFHKSRFNRATQGMRQPGSTFKPIVYVAAIDYLGYTPSTIVPDEPISIVTESGEVWEPRNFERTFIGDITLRTAIQKSKNVAAAYVIQQVEVDRVVNLARKFGLTTPIGRDPSISLGAADTRLIEMTSLYGIFASGGKLAQRIVVSKITDRYGEVVYEQPPKLDRVLSEETSFLMTNMLRGVVQRGTATIVNQLGVPVAGKTGTANSQTDTTFIGYTPQWVSGVWVGFDTKKVLGENEMAAGRVVAPIFLNFMKDFLAGTEPVDFPIPDGVVAVPIDINTGLYSDSEDAFIEYFKKGTAPIAGAIDTRATKSYLSSDEF